MKKMSQQQLHSLIERFFNAETSVAEERKLRTYLAFGKYNLTPEVEDALAVMSVQRKRKQARPTHFIAPLKWAAAAAVVSVIAIVGINQFSEPTQTVSYAYIGGKYTNDSKVLNKLMNEQINDLAEQMQLSQDNFDSQIAELSEAMQQYEN